MSKQSEIGKNLRRRARNRLTRNDIKAKSTALRKAVQAKDAGLAEEKQKDLMPVLDRAARKGVLHKKTAARKKSRLAAKVNSLKETPSG